MEEEIANILEPLADADACEVDFDYEFDAPRFFEFGRPETPDEASAAELWFNVAGTYPPSPWMRMAINFVKENVNIIPKLEVGQHVPDESCAFGNSLGASLDVVDWDYVSGLTFNDHRHILKTKSDGTESIKIGTTLLRTTAGEIGKQNKVCVIGNSKLHPQRLPKSSLVQKSGLVPNEKINGVQASKRQKLDGGCTQKIFHLQPEKKLVHKNAQQNNVNGPMSEHFKLKLTIPRAPELRTAKRAERPRNKVQSEDTSRIYTFRALPLNRKILERPSSSPPVRTVPKEAEFREFHLKTSERAAKYANSPLSSLNFSFNAKNGHEPVPPTELLSKLTLDPRDPPNGISTTFSQPNQSSFKLVLKPRGQSNAITTRFWQPNYGSLKCRELKENVFGKLLEKDKGRTQNRV